MIQGTFLSVADGLLSFEVPIPNPVRKRMNGVVQSRFFRSFRLKPVNKQDKPVQRLNHYGMN